MKNCWLSFYTIEAPPEGGLKNQPKRSTISLQVKLGQFLKNHKFNKISKILSNLMKSSLGAQRYSWGPQRGPQGSKMRLGEGFVEALGKLWEALGGFGKALGRLWEVRERAQAQRETTHPYI